MADLEKENIRKVEALREASCIELSYLRDVFSKDAYRFEEKSKKYLIDRYKEELNEYLISYKRVQEERISLMIIPLVLKSVGTIPAENIDVIVKFPQDIEPFRTLPEFPEEPKGPEEPKTSAELMESAFAISYPRLPVISESERPVDEIFKGLW